MDADRKWARFNETDNDAGALNRRSDTTGRRDTAQAHKSRGAFRLATWKAFVAEIYADQAR